MHNLGLVGDTQSVQEIERFIRSTCQLNTDSICLDGNIELDTQVGRIKALSKHCVAILYTRRFYYDYFNYKFYHDKPTTYVAIDQEEIYAALLRLMLNNDESITRLSFDSAELSDIKHVYSKLNLPTETIKHVVPNYSGKDYYQQLLNEHQSSDAVVLTDVPSLKANLEAQSKAVSLFSRSHRAITAAIDALRIQLNLSRRRINKIAILTVSLSMPSENFILENTQFALINEYNKVAEAIYWFTEQINGSFFSTSRKVYHIICDSATLESHTNQLAKIQLLNTIAENELLSMFIGIGYGDTYRESLRNATLAHSRATAREETRAFLAKSSKAVYGPFYPDRTFKDHANHLYDMKFEKIAKECSISINTIYKLYESISQDKKNEYTSDIIAKYLNVTPRSANRFIAKLLENHYAEVIGVKSLGGKGRPQRVYKILI